MLFWYLIICYIIDKIIECSFMHVEKNLSYRQKINKSKLINISVALKI